MLNFQEALTDCGLADLGFHGYEFTYDNGRSGDDNVQCRLDRGVANVEWLNLFPDAKVMHLLREWSDHAPIKVVLHKGEEGRKKRIFRFEESWTTHEQCKNIILEAWQDDSSNAAATISKCAAGLAAWANAERKIRRLLQRKRDQLKNLNMGRLSRDQMARRRGLIREISSLINEEEKYWRQRSRAIWIKEGDRNTSFFHKTASIRKERNTIKQIVNEEGSQCTSRSEIEGAIRGYFSNLFESCRPEGVEQVLQCVEPSITADMRRDLDRCFSREEVETALSQMHPLKSPGPDGMCALFYKCYWDIVGNKISDEALSFLNGGVLPADINNTFIVLIPKKNNAKEMKDYRPISLCNVLYKLISKVLANRLKCMLERIISPNQSGFVPGRMITDNFMIAFEIFHHLSSNGKNLKQFALKLDMSKAYDRIEWMFLEKMMHKMGFSSHWISRVMSCVSTVSFSVLLNGQPTEQFFPARGLRQGDPLSPYLFIICGQALSALIENASNRSLLQGIRVAQSAPPINHLLYADDCLLFADAEVAQAAEIKSILHRYERASGQMVNYDKTEICFSEGTPVDIRNAVLQILEVRQTDQFGKYLGLPPVVGRAKKEIFKAVKAKVERRLCGWKSMLLSKPGREIMIKAVAQSIPTYCMSMFKLPKTFCNDLQSSITRFWWSQRKDERKIHWCSWKKLCQAKKKGGMGFRELKWFNWALLGKQGWRLMKNPDLLVSRVLKAKYFPFSSFMDARLGPRPSYLWRSIAEARWVIEKGARWQIGNGLQIRVWKDPWILGNDNFKALSPCPPNLSSLRVSHLFWQETGTWNSQLIRETFLPFEADRILAMPLGVSPRCDRMVWSLDKWGEYTVKSAYHKIKANSDAAEFPGVSHQDPSLWNKIWSANVTPRIKVFAWSVCNAILPVNFRIAKRIEGFDSTCPCCLDAEETEVHLLRDCAYSKKVWRSAGMKLVNGLNRGDDLIEAMASSCDSRDFEFFLCLCWKIWNRRNEWVFDHSFREDPDLVNEASALISELNGFKAPLTSGGVVMPAAKWTAPAEGRFKLNTDASVQEGVGTGLGVAIRDHEGRLVTAITEQLDVEFTPLVAEAKALIKGIQIASAYQLPFVEIESDCLGLIEAAKGSRPCPVEIDFMVQDISLLCNLLSEFSISFIRRGCNGFAHELARVCPWRTGVRVWDSCLPALACKAYFQDMKE